MHSPLSNRDDVDRWTPFDALDQKEREISMGLEIGSLRGSNLSDRAEMLECFFDFITADFATVDRRPGSWKQDLGKTPEEKLAEGHKINQQMALRVVAIVWMVFPAKVDGKSLRTLAGRHNADFQLLDYYVKEFEKAFGLRGRGQKSPEASESYAAVQAGNQHRLGKSKNTQPTDHL